MLSKTQITFLQEKVLQLRSALFFSMSNSVLKIPTTIVSALKVDEVGQVWFLIHRPSQQIQEFDKEFPAKLDFFKKGENFYLKLIGKACLVSDPEELNEVISVGDEDKQKASDGFILVKVRVSQISYYVNEEEQTSTWIGTIRSQFSKWLHKPQPRLRPYSFSSDSFA
jgi:general stress protein 26